MKVFMKLLFSVNTWSHYSGAVAATIMLFGFFAFLIIPALAPEMGPDFRMDLVLAVVAAVFLCLLVEAIEFPTRTIFYPTLKVYYLDTLKDLIVDGLGIWTAAAIILKVLDILGAL